MPPERLPLSTVLPRAWIGFCSAPWPCVGLAALALISAFGLGSLAQELHTSGHAWVRHLGDLFWVLSMLAPLVPLLALLQLADTLLPSAGPDEHDSPQTRERIPWLLRQSLALVLIEALILFGGITAIRSVFSTLIAHSGVLAALSALIGSVALIAWTFAQCLALPLLIHHGYRPLAAMEHSRKLVQQNRLKVLALVGLILGINLVGLMGACLGLILSLPFSALILMASCRTQAPWSKDWRRNILPT
ncbi:hypothetical protein [Synechococcus sp. UW140]|uniref:hypothetical protein n=1 Tax=Synechococcus sp. UW140 TaxID=368503 RepID=UPI000E0F2387|nr:hypothetical protein [Synechococcus sp. UW140]